MGSDSIGPAATAIAAAIMAGLAAAQAAGAADDGATDLSLAVAEGQMSYLAPPAALLSGAALQDAEEKPAEGADGEAKEEEKKGLPWKLALDFAFNAVTGNTEETTLRFGITAGYDTGKTKLALDASYYWKATDSITTDNKFTAGARHDWLWPDSRWFWFVGGRFDWDQFQSWEERINFQGGPGYHILKKEDHNLNLELDAYAGIGARKEWASLNDDWKAEGLLGLDYTYYITDRMTLAVNLNYYPTFSSISDYRLRSTGTWRYALTNGQNLSLVMGYLLEYQSIVNPGNETTDFRIWIGIQYELF
jgi:putative salt-induced outer membrane protein YdiY